MSEEENRNGSRIYYHPEEEDVRGLKGIWNGFRGVLLCVLGGATYGAMLGGALGGAIGLCFFIIGVIYGLPIGMVIGIIAGASCGFFAGILGERWGWATGSALGAALDLALGWGLNSRGQGIDSTSVSLMLVGIAATGFLGYMVFHWVWKSVGNSPTFFTPFATGLQKVGYLRTTPLDRFIGGLLVLLVLAILFVGGYAALRG